MLAMMFCGLSSVSIGPLGIGVAFHGALLPRPWPVTTCTLSNGCVQHHTTGHIHMLPHVLTLAVVVVVEVVDLQLPYSCLDDPLQWKSAPSACMLLQLFVLLVQVSVLLLQLSVLLLQLFVI